MILDDSATVLKNQKDVIGYASWGSNDHDRKERFLHFEWLPGAIMTEFVSTNGRTFKRPPDTWQIGPWTDKSALFQRVAADAERGLHPRGSQRRVWPCGRTVSHRLPAVRNSFCPLTIRAEPWRKATIWGFPA